MLTGVYNPGGALSYTAHTQRFADVTPYDSMQMRPNRSNGSGSPGRTHRFFDGSAATGCPACASWPFGFGLSYTTFALGWGGGAPPAAAAAPGDTTAYALTVRNTGELTGDVVVACYVTALEQTAVARPPRQSLWAFDRVEGLAAGASATLAFSLAPDGRALTTAAGRRVVPKGRFAVRCSAGEQVSVSANLTVA